MAILKLCALMEPYLLSVCSRLISDLSVPSPHTCSTECSLNDPTKINKGLMRQPIGTAWSPVGLVIRASCGPVPSCTPTSILCAKCDAQVSAMASASGRKPSGWHVMETHLHTGIDHRHKHHQGQQQETRQVEAQHEQGAGVEGRERVRRNCNLLVGSPSPTVSQEPACPAFGAQIPGPSDCFPKKSSCSKGPCRTVLRYSPLLLIPPSGHHHGGSASYPQGANGELRNTGSTVCLLAIHGSASGSMGELVLKITC